MSAAQRTADWYPSSWTDPRDALVAELEAKLAAAEVVAMRAVRAEADRAEAEARVRRCAERMNAVMDIVANPDLDPADKLVGIAAFRHLGARERGGKDTDDEGRTRISVAAVARLAGVSADTAGKRVKRLADAGVLERYEGGWYNSAAGRPETVLSLRAQGDDLERLRALAGAKLERKHGGERIRCPRRECGSENVVRVTRYRCEDCHHTWSGHEAPANPKEPQDAGQATRAVDAHVLEPGLAEKEPQDAAQRYTPTSVPHDAVPITPPPPRQYPIPPPSPGIEEVDAWSGVGLPMMQKGMVRPRGRG